jgi:hypothetical protein
MVNHLYDKFEDFRVKSKNKKKFILFGQVYKTIAKIIRNNLKTRILVLSLVSSKDKLWKEDNDLQYM